MPTSSSPEGTDAQHASPSRPRTADPVAAGEGASAAAADSLWAALRQTPLDAGLWLALARDYQRHELPWQAAYAARQALRSDPGARAQLETLALGDRQDPNAGDAQLGQPRLAHAAALIEHFRARTRERPDDWLTWLYLARLHDMRAAEQSAAADHTLAPAAKPGSAMDPPLAAADRATRSDTALADPPTTPGAPDPTPASARDAALAQARQHEILPGESLHWLGVWRLNAGDAAGAVDALSALIDIRPPRHGSLMYLGEALLRSDRSAAAETAFSRASQSANPDFLCDLAARVYAHNYWREAIALLQKALALRPEHVPTWLALARIQSEVHLLGDCRDSLARIARLAPGHPEAALLTAGLHGRLGDARSQRLAQQELLAANDDPLSRLASSIAMTALYDDSLTASEIAALHRQLCAPMEAALPERSGFPNPRTTQRRLRIGYVTGDLDIHDLAVDGDGRLVFVNTLFGCLATLSETHSFKPLWRPRFVSRLAAEDRCHLNGLAIRDGRPAYVTAVSQSDVVDGWRDHRADGGVVIDVASDEIIAGGLSMPHSPRWYRDRLWLLNSGSGEFGYVDRAAGRFVPVTFCAGYLRGLAFHGDFALVGLSKPRHNRTFSGLPLEDRLQAHGAEARCAVRVIDLRRGDIVHWLRFEGIVDELYDVVTLPGVRRRMALGFKTDEIRRVLSIEG